MRLTNATQHRVYPPLNRLNFLNQKKRMPFQVLRFLGFDEQNACLDAANRLKHQGLMTTRPSHARSNCSRFFKRQKQKRQMVNLAFF